MTKETQLSKFKEWLDFCGIKYIDRDPSRDSDVALRYKRHHVITIGNDVEDIEFFFNFSGILVAITGNDDESDSFVLFCLPKIKSETKGETPC